MPAVYHGKIKLWWCKNCNVPLVSKKCNICGREGGKVKITPPGDIRPAFEGDLEIINSILNEQFGIENGLKGIVLLNRIPAEDMAYEIIYNGKVIGILRYEKKFRISLKPEGVEIFKNEIKKGYVIADSGAEEALLKGRNLMIPGVIEISNDIKIGDYVAVFCKNSVGVGISKVNANNLPKKGVAIKMKGFKKIENFSIDKTASWKDVINANKNHLRKIEKEAIEFIRKTVEDIKLPVLASFSGGKDSMATLLLLIKSGVKFDVFFLNTGIEFEETVDYVNSIEKKYSLKIKRISSDDRFWKSLSKYGVPARDYRWCCKVVKLGPTTRFILQNYPKGVLTFIGQRKYESDVRSRTPRVWKNKWVPNQISASPIQNWNALEVFLYLFKENAPINIWYKRGMNRIGCYLCPASDLGDFEIIKKYSNVLEKWINYLQKYSKENHLPEDWIDKGLWRWVKVPKRFGYNIPKTRKKLYVDRKEIDSKIKFIPNKEIDKKRLENLSYILPDNCYDIHSLTTEKNCEEYFLKIIYKAEECVGCGICLAHCPTGAIYIENNEIWINKQKCIKCKKCLESMCPAVSWHSE